MTEPKPNLLIERTILAMKPGCGLGRGGEPLHVGDRRAQGIVHFELQDVGDVEDGVIGERRGPVEAAPGFQHASRRPGIGAAMAQEKHIAQRRLVLAAARDPRTGGAAFSARRRRHTPAKGASARTRASSMASAAPAWNAAPEWASVSVTGGSLRAQLGRGGATEKTVRASGAWGVRTMAERSASRRFWR
jgi:hypothetical protein